MKNYFFLILFFVLYGCQNNSCKTLGGVWTIEKMTVNQKDFLPYLYVNTFGFHCNDNSAWFQASSFFENDRTATWQLLDHNGKIEAIRIKSKIKIYNDTFTIKIENQRHLILESKTVYIVAHKIVDDY